MVHEKVTRKRDEGKQRRDKKQQEDRARTSGWTNRLINRNKAMTTQTLYIKISILRPLHNDNREIRDLDNGEMRLDQQEGQNSNGNNGKRKHKQQKTTAFRETRG